ncbi:hypothetical protein [Nocardioides sp. TF02-7]|uniref:hypothetical protein n=1 Tax=Nocardioides sp. TF02-7 TaxID=2917724 RepID=UPI001F06D9DB|nr:hypothetical protein [Nocardioides sp. TF02-7]UMG92348.1 hypothetical protein MF408_21035 [Nocardioides sp. TF02-7]
MLARLLQRLVVGDLPAGAVEVVGVGGDDHQAGRHLVDPPVLVVRVGSPALGEAEHLAGEGAPGVEVGAGDAHVPHGLDVDRHRLLLGW